MLTVHSRTPATVAGSARPLARDPFTSQFDRMINAFFQNDLEQTTLTGFYPVDIHEQADQFVIEAELPGFNKSDVNITLEDGVLSFIAERKESKKSDDDKAQTHLKERRFTRVARSFQLPTAVNESSVKANLADGVLTITLSKREEVKPRKIQVD